MRTIAAFIIALLTPNFAIAQPVAHEFAKFVAPKWNVVCSDFDVFKPKMRVTVVLQRGYIESFGDNDLARKYAEYVRDRSFSYCNDELARGKVSSVAQLYLITIEVPGTIANSKFQTGGFITLYLVPRNGDAFSTQTETQYSNSVINYLESIKRDRAQQQAASQAAEARRQEEEAKKSQKKAVRDRFMASHSLTQLVSPQALITNPFSVKGKKVAIVLRFDRMIGDGEALFEGIVVRSVPNTMFREVGWAFLGVEVDGMRQVPALGNVSAPSATFLAAYICHSAACREVMD